ncbi:MULTISPECIES: winged helix-turn-helix domain-containing protein [Pandoraea]|uniref:winged helix-turn-helix domain-containing protein n=1 Tax=Pandoraea TaxID=93217 RepID=UPI0003D1DE84|nr:MULTISPECIES: winged helix-turn-helix domain-containing protein [Pandoraea]AHB78352.1 hypothetical protein X636_03165 [Pandoraea pnomenusa]
MVKFLIGDIAGFDTDTFALVSRRDDALSVSLGATAGRCLQVLLEADGEIVTKRTLLAQGWEQYGAVVTDNNLSQSIVRIRRALQHLGADPGLLVTLPRIGYRLTGVTRVSPFVEAPPPPSTTVENGRTDATTDREIAQSSRDESETSSVENSPASGDGIGTATRVQGPSVWPAVGIWVSVAAISAVLAAWTIPSLRGDVRTNAKSAQWTALDATPGNRVFVAPDYRENTDFVTQRLARLASTPPVTIGDASDRYVYINGAGNFDVFSYFLCREPIGRADSDCLSYLLIDHATS